MVLPLKTSLAAFTRVSRSTLSLRQRATLFSYFSPQQTRIGRPTITSRSTSMVGNMKAWQQMAPGPMEEMLKLVNNVPRPNAELKEGEILVRVISACINPGEYKVMEAGLMARAAIKFPKTPGMDVSGNIVDVAKGSTDVKIGDSILGRLDPMSSTGSLSQYVILPRESYAVISRGVDLDHAAGIPTTGMTAYRTIKPYVKPGDRVFINGGSGGTGTFGIQIAKALGCHVTTSCSTGKISLVKKLGADAIIDYRADSVVSKLKAEGQVYDLVVDNIGHSPQNFFSTTPSFLKPNGHYVFVGGSASMQTMKTMVKGLVVPSILGGTPRKFVPYVTKNVREDFEQLAKWLADGTVSTAIDSTFEFEQAVEAYKHLKEGSSAGKIIVHVSPKT